MSAQTTQSSGPTKFERFARTVSAVGFAGLGALAVLRFALGLSEREFMSSTAGAVATFVFVGIFVLGLIVLTPLAVFDRRRTHPNTPRAGDPKVPQWLSWPIMALFFVLLAFVIVGLTAALLNAL